jgi:hypothetical protein
VERIEFVRNKEMSCWQPDEFMTARNDLLAYKAHLYTLACRVIRQWKRDGRVRELPRGFQTIANGDWSTASAAVDQNWLTRALDDYPCVIAQIFNQMSSIDEKVVNISLFRSYFRLTL